MTTFRLAFVPLRDSVVIALILLTSLGVSRLSAAEGEASDGSQPTAAGAAEPTRKFSGYRRLKARGQGAVTIVVPVDKRLADEQLVYDFGLELQRLVERDGAKNIVINLGSVEHLSAAAMGKLIQFDKQLKKVNGKLVLSNLGKPIQELFSVIRLDQYFAIEKEEADAVKAFKKPQ